MNRRPSLFVGNYDDGIQVRGVLVANIDDAFTGATTGALAKKCIEVAPRGVHLVGREGAVLAYEALPDGYAAYCEDFYGYAPTVLYPSEPYTDLDQPLSLLQSVLADKELLERIRMLGARHGWVITPFIGHPFVYELGRRTGLHVNTTREDLLLGGRVGDLNDKAKFQIVCGRLGIPVPPSIHVQGWGELVRAAAEAYERDGSVMLRRARAAGGLGNCEVNPEKLARAGKSTVGSYLEHVLQPIEEWEREVVLVEPVLDLVASPAVLMRMRHGRVRLVAVVDQVTKDKEFLGGDFPSSMNSEVRDQIVEWSLRYARECVVVEDDEEDGYVDVDWGITRDSEIVAFESNRRVTGNNHPLGVVDRLRGGDDVQFWSSDALKLAPGTTFAQVQRFLAQHQPALGGRSCDWDPSTGEGVIITIPPGRGAKNASMGYVAIADTRRMKLALRDAMDAFALTSWRAAAAK